MAIGSFNLRQVEAVIGMYDPKDARLGRAINDEGSALRVGTFVAFKTTNGRDCVEAPDAQTDKCRGVLAYVPEEHEVDANTTVNELTIADDALCTVVERGRVFALIDEGQTPTRGDPVYVRVASEAPDTILGTARTDEDTDKAGLLSGAIFDSEAIDLGDVTGAWVMLTGPLNLSDP